MSKTKSEVVSVLTAEQAGRVDRAKSYHAACGKSFQDHIIYAFLAGAELNALKEPLEHGRWMTFCAENFPQIKHRTATQYMAFHTKLAPGANLPEGGIAALLTNGEPKPELREKIFHAAQDQEGKTFTELCRALGIRDKKPHEHHPIKPLTPDEQLAARRAQAESVVKAIESAIAIVQIDLSAKDDSVCALCVEPKRWKELSRALVGLNKQIKPLMKRKVHRGDAETRRKS